MAFCKPLALVVQHQFTVKKLWHRQAQGTVDQYLPRRADEQVRTAHDLGNLHGGVIDCDTVVGRGTTYGRLVLFASDAVRASLQKRLVAVAIADELGLTLATKTAAGPR